MARFYDTVLAELNEAKEELSSLALMSEKEICYLYNTDSKAEIAKVLKEEIEALEKEVEYLTPTVYEPEYNY
ncbi:hypothetical protein [Parabacteroides pacaensis]|uniref:hypothetical protein n=1 Tax=Parabacteroides pacaensis TaxID=2086575 RepID=UPI000D0F12AC|nr:hypothetical protein [Parabacteroides pacaensis]